MSNDWTPGPWRVVDNRDMCREWWIVAEHPEVGAVSHATVRPGCDEVDELGDMEANAHLIAAAPELYDALEGVVRIADRNTAEFDAARAALAKAKGERP